MTAKSSQRDTYVKAEQAFNELGLCNSNHPLLLMVSGGSDSVALLHLTLGICNSATFLQVLHINHQLRGAEADADERFVVELCDLLGVACAVERVDVTARSSQSKESVEQVGRRCRYERAHVALQELCSKQNTSIDEGSILTAHTADDRAETLLQRLIVGGGGGSLASIPQRNGLVVRPLLGCSREELCSWVVSLGKDIAGQFWREDASNLDTSLSRAFVRHEVLPLLASRNPRIKEGLNRTAEVLTSESSWMDELAFDLLPLSKDSFEAPLPLLRRAVYQACNEAIEELSPGARITFEHVEQIVKGGARNGFACQIPGGIEVRTRRGILEFYKAKPPLHDPRL